MNDITSLIALAGFMALLGAVLLWRGMRGRRHGDHPYCRRCGFNLFGTPGDSKVCPECGGDLSVPRAIVIGVKLRRTGMAATGAAMLLPAVFILLTILGGTLAGVDWTKRAPPWWLIRQAQSNDTITRDVALAELLSRSTAGTLSNQHLTDAVKAGLDYQGDAKKPWSVGWGDLIEAAEKKGLVSADQWARYAKQAVTNGSLKVTVRERIHPGDPVGYVLETVAGDRVGKSGVRLYKALRINGLTIDGTEMMGEPGGGMLTTLLNAGGTPSAGPTRTLSTGGFGGSTAGTGVVYFSGTTASGRGAISRGTLEVDPTKMSQLQPGVHNGELRIGMKVTPNMPLRTSSIRINFPAGAINDPAAVQKQIRDQQMQRDRDMFNTAQPVLAEDELKIPIKLEVLPPNESTLVKIEDEKLRNAVEASVSVNRLRAMGSRLEVQLSCSNPPVDLSFAIFVREGEKEWPAGSVVFPKGTSARIMPGMAMGGFVLPGQGPTGSTVDVVLRPDPTGAMSNPEISSYWGGEIVLKNVPMEQSPRLMTVDSVTSADPFTLNRNMTSPLVSTANTLLLRLESPAAKEGGTKQSRELMIYPRVPFMQRFVDGEGGNATTTRISGVLASSGGSGSSRYTLELEYTESRAGKITLRERFDESTNLSIGQSIPFGKSGKTITILPWSN